MAKKLVIHALFTYTDPATKTLARAYRGDTINVTGKDLERGMKHGAFGTAADLAPPVDEGVVDPTPDASTPLVPHVAQGVRIEAALRDRLGLEPGATESDVVTALDEALAKAKAANEDLGTAPAPEPAQISAPPAPVEPVLVNQPPAEATGYDEGDLPPTGEHVVVNDTGEPEAVHTADQLVPVPDAGDDGGQAVPAEARLERPLNTAVKAKWEAFAVQEGMAAGEAKAASKQDLIAKYGGS